MISSTTLGWIRVASDVASSSVWLLVAEVSSCSDNVSQFFCTCSTFKPLIELGLVPSGVRDAMESIIDIEKDGNDAAADDWKPTPIILT